MGLHSHAVTLNSDVLHSVMQAEACLSEKVEVSRAGVHVTGDLVASRHRKMIMMHRKLI